MSEVNQFDWVDFYKELSGKLLQYKDNREALIKNVRKIYELTGINLPTLEKDNQIIDIDPFTFFGLFNKKLTDTNRLSILKAIAELFDVKAPVPTAFDSIPVLNPQNATFYYFIPDRGDDDIQDLWELFDSALAYAKDPSPETIAKVSKYFDLCINKKGNGNSKITMGLYWIAPNALLNLDQRNSWYIYESGKIPEDIVKTLPEIEAKIPSDKYFDIVEKLRAYLQSDNSQLKDFKELSYAAWRYSEQVNQEQATAKKVEAQRENKGAAIADEGVETIHYWIYAPGDGAMYWDEFYSTGIMGIGWDAIGDLSAYNTKSEMRQAMQEKIDPSRSFKNDAHATWQFVNEMKPGDIIFAKKGMHQMIGRGVVASDYEFDPQRNHYKNIRQVKWTHKGEWQHPGQAVMKTLTDITAYTDYVEKLNSLFESEIENDIAEPIEMDLKPYDADMFLEEVYMDKTKYDTLVALVEKKKNVILQGAPGVGKTFAAKRLAYSIMGVKDPSRVMMVQFHQSYSYEDFIMGFRPTQEGGFELKHGAFYDFCKSAEVDSEDTPYFFIIDEINRGNLSKIFGELFMLIESDKRGIELKLLYADEKFSVPKNVYIIGMMNTADRSLAMMDYALRRRFAFFDMDPGFNTKGFRQYQEGLQSEKFNKLIDRVEALNADIASDDSLGEGFCIGHSYFCELKETSDQTLSGIVEFELAPLLKEYWFDEPAKAKTWIDDLRSAIK
ncbi:AAA family ATPase [Oribacterium sp. FC2011]|uniref:AAA family ATPase n=1 Tax=Oribacterium sp. FC2011 TaxID=1408311 RepID=UPI0004E1B216|nr:AAA family ATPase [Oribacterium sp. FC2011]